MSVQYVLDTDHVTLFQHRHPLIVQRVLRCTPESLAISIVTLEEQLQGRLALLHRAKREEDVVRGYARLGEAIAFFQAVQVVFYTDEAAAMYTSLRSQGLRIGTKDLRIAAIAVALGATVVTRNRRDFERVPGIAIEDWSV
jgi:tRNA(fMet)-specific endonuclease VapC